MSAALTSRASSPPMWKASSRTIRKLRLAFVSGARSRSWLHHTCFEAYRARKLLMRNLIVTSRFYSNTPRAFYTTNLKIREFIQSRPHTPTQFGEYSCKIMTCPRSGNRTHTRRQDRFSGAKEQHLYHGSPQPAPPHPAPHRPTPPRPVPAPQPPGL